MSSIWNAVAKETSIAMEYVKIKAGVTDAEVEPEYDAACQKLEWLNSNINKLQADIETILNLAQKTAQATSDISFNATKVQNIISVPQLRAQIEPLNVNLGHNNYMTQEYLCKIQRSKGAEILNPVLAKLRELNDLRVKRNKHKLHTRSISSDIDQYAKSEKTEKLLNAQIKYEETSRKCEEVTKNFLEAVNELYEQRNEIIEKYIQEFSGIVYTFMQLIYGNQIIKENKCPTHEYVLESP